MKRKAGEDVTERLRRQIARGEYVVDPSAVAEALLRRRADLAALAARTRDADGSPGASRPTRPAPRG